MTTQGGTPVRSDNLGPAGGRVPEWVFRQDAPVVTEPPPYQDGPRCGHGEPMALACPQCADPLTLPPEEDRPMHALRRLWRLLTTPIRPRRPGWDRRETR